MGLDLQEPEALSGSIRLQPGCAEPIFYEIPEGEGALLELYYRVGLSSDGYFVLVDPSGQNVVDIGMRQSVTSPDFQAFTLSKQRLSKPGVVLLDKDANLPFIVVSAKKGCLVLSQTGLNLRKTAEVEGQRAIVRQAAGLGCELGEEDDTDGKGRPPLKDHPDALPKERVAVRAVMDEFVTVGGGRRFFGSLLKEGRFDSKNFEQVRMAWDVILEEVDTSDLCRLSCLFDFVNDFPDHFGGSFAGLNRVDSGLPLKELHRSLIDRLLREDENTLEGARFVAFNRLYSRADFGDLAVERIPTFPEKIKYMKTKLKRIRALPYFSS